MPNTVGKKLLVWDESIDGEVHDRMLRQQEEILAGDITANEKKTKEETVQEIYADQDFWSWRWSDLTDALTEILRRKNKAGFWRAQVRNFGWRSLDGHKVFKALSGSEFLREILPQTDCHFTVFNFGRGLAIQNFHHDSPVGNEWYYIVPTTQRAYEDL